MTMMQPALMFTRREFVAIPAMAVGAAVTGFTQAAPLTAGQVVDRIKQIWECPGARGRPIPSRSAMRAALSRASPPP
jgi:tryptophan synthase alpha subunit